MVIRIITVAHNVELRVRVEYADKEVTSVIISVLYIRKLCMCAEHMNTE